MIKSKVTVEHIPPLLFREIVEQLEAALEEFRSVEDVLAVD